MLGAVDEENRPEGSEFLLLMGVSWLKEDNDGNGHLCHPFPGESWLGGLLSNQTEQGPCVSVRWAWKKSHGSRELQVWDRSSHMRNGGLGQMCNSGEGKEGRIEGSDLPRPVSWWQVERRRNCKSLWTWRTRMVGKCTVGRWALCSFSVVHYSQVVIEWTPFGDGQTGPWVWIWHRTRAREVCGVAGFTVASLSKYLLSACLIASSVLSGLGQED